MSGIVLSLFSVNRFWCRKGANVRPSTLNTAAIEERWQGGAAAAEDAGSCRLLQTAQPACSHLLAAVYEFRGVRPQIRNVFCTAHYSMQLAQCCRWWKLSCRGWILTSLRTFDIILLSLHRNLHRQTSQTRFIQRTGPVTWTWWSMLMSRWQN